MQSPVIAAGFGFAADERSRFDETKKNDGEPGGRGFPA
jgi:hypothetical protein